MIKPNLHAVLFIQSLVLCQIKIIHTFIVYLRGVEPQEMKSFLQFIYLGQATFYQNRLNVFLVVAKSLEIKEISIHVAMNDESLNQSFLQLNTLFSEATDSQHFDCKLLCIRGLEQIDNIDNSHILPFQIIPLHVNFITLMNSLQKIGLNQISSTGNSKQNSRIEAVGATSESQSLEKHTPQCM